MTKWILPLALLVSAASYADCMSQPMEGSESHDNAKVFDSHERNYREPALTETGHLSVKGMQITGFDKNGLIKIQSAFNLMESVSNSLEFKDRVINFKNDKGQRAFASNNGLTNEQIYAIYMSGKETLQQNTPGEMNFFLKQYNRWWSKVIGYTSADVNLINVNYKFFKNYRPSDVAGNLTHEWTHKIGFDHASAAEHDSAPYAIGYIMDELAEAVAAGKLELHY